MAKEKTTDNLFIVLVDLVAARGPKRWPAGPAPQDLSEIEPEKLVILEARNRIRRPKAGELPKS